VSVEGPKQGHNNSNGSSGKASTKKACLDVSLLKEGGSAASEVKGIDGTSGTGFANDSALNVVPHVLGARVAGGGIKASVSSRSAEGANGTGVVGGGTSSSASSAVGFGRACLIAAWGAVHAEALVGSGIVSSRFAGNALRLGSIIRSVFSRSTCKTSGGIVGSRVKSIVAVITHAGKVAALLTLGAAETAT